MIHHSFAHGVACTAHFLRARSGGGRGARTKPGARASAGDAGWSRRRATGGGLAAGVGARPSRVGTGGAGVECGRVRQQRGAHASGTAPSFEPRVARPQAAVLERPQVCVGQVARPLPVGIAGSEAGQLRPLDLTPDGPGRIEETTIKFGTCGMRRGRHFGIVSPTEGRG